MIIIALLLVALVCLVLGLVLASGPFLIGSLVASGVVAYLLWHQRDQLGGRARTSQDGAARAPAGPRPLVTGTAFESSGPPNGASIEQKRADAKERATKIAGKDDVWVVDGKANFHSEYCAQIEGLGAEPVPVGQAVQDGFTSCPFCKPAGVRHDRQVWVVDGAPEYHEASCATITELQAVAVPLAQADADGFVPCGACDAGRSGAAGDGPGRGGRHSAPERPTPGGSAGSASPGEVVWVVDGRPRFHAGDCLIIVDHEAEAIPLVQATEDGFIPCTLCMPAAGTADERSAGAPQPQVQP